MFCALPHTEPCSSHLKLNVREKFQLVWRFSASVEFQNRETKRSTSPEKTEVITLRRLEVWVSFLGRDGVATNFRIGVTCVESKKMFGNRKSIASVPPRATSVLIMEYWRWCWIRGRSSVRENLIRAVSMESCLCRARLIRWTEWSSGL